MKNKELTEEEFLINYKAGADKYPRPSLTADIAVFAADGKNVKILLVRRGGHPFRGFLALPGGFAKQDEPVEATAARELLEETGLEAADLIPVNIYSAPGRDPRGWTVSMLYACKVSLSNAHVAAGDDAEQAGWFDLGTAMGTELAFDHSLMLRDAARKMGYIR